MEALSVLLLPGWQRGALEPLAEDLAMLTENKKEESMEITSHMETYGSWERFDFAVVWTQEIARYERAMPVVVAIAGDKQRSPLAAVLSAHLHGRKAARDNEVNIYAAKRIRKVSRTASASKRQ
jgi:hypothetical protein